nr:hypothetical protein [Tanacetum cinerariifolium]
CEKVDEQNTEEILDKENSNSSGSTAQVQPSVGHILILEPDVSRTQTKPTIPYPSSTTLVTELDKVTESSAKNLVPIPTEYEVTSDNEKSHCLNVESNLLNLYLIMILRTLKFDYLEEFFGALMPIRIADEERIRREHVEYISLMERLITINLCPHPMENSNTIVESLTSSLIPLQDSNSQREEIDIVTETDELLPLSFENDDYDSEREIYVLEELLVVNSIPSSENKLSDFDHDNPLFPRPPPEPPDVEFDFEPNSGGVILVMMTILMSLLMMNVLN